jgi:hypothetical protein
MSRKRTTSASYLTAAKSPASSSALDARLTDVKLTHENFV